MGIYIHWLNDVQRAAAPGCLQSAKLGGVMPAVGAEDPSQLPSQTGALCWPADDDAWPTQLLGT